MCGNGARCIARYAFEKGIVKSPSMRFETLGGEVCASVDGRMAALELAPVSLDEAVRGRVTVDGVDYEYTYIIVGVPHTVIFEEKCSRAFADYAPLGRAIRERTDLFPRGTNVNFTVAAGRRPRRNGHTSAASRI